jgi:hypothetical protein
VQERIGPMITFYWTEEDLITSTGKDYISIR